MGEWFGDSRIKSINQTDVFMENNEISRQLSTSLSARKIGTSLTILGVLLLDLDCDACQSPSRAYLLDVTDSSEHSLGLTTFTSMAGLGGCLGYFLGGIPWEKTFLSHVLGDHVHVLFTLVWLIYVFCMLLTLTASKEPTDVALIVPNLSRSASRQGLISSCSMASVRSGLENEETSQLSPNRNMKFSYKNYLRSIIYMPAALRWLCLTNFFCWMALVSYSLFFTDFVGQAVFGK